jgi:hypothetical protein
MGSVTDTTKINIVSSTPNTQAKVPELKKNSTEGEPSTTQSKGGNSNYAKSEGSA